jgi:hypothetical protein
MQYGHKWLNSDSDCRCNSRCVAVALCCVFSLSCTKLCVFVQVTSHSLPSLFALSLEWEWPLCHCVTTVCCCYNSHIIKQNSVFSYRWWQKQLAAVLSLYVVLTVPFGYRVLVPGRYCFLCVQHCISYPGR